MITMKLVVEIQMFATQFMLGHSNCSIRAFRHDFRWIDSLTLCEQYLTYIHDKNKITGNWTMDECLQQGMMTDRSENGLATGHYRLRLTNLLFAVLSF